MAQPIARWLELHASSAPSTRGTTPRSCPRATPATTRASASNATLDCGLEGGHAKRAAAAARQEDSDSRGGPGADAEPVLSDGESPSPQSDGRCGRWATPTGNATAATCPQAASKGSPELRRKLESAGKGRVHRTIHRRPASLITSMAAMDVSSVPRGSPADVALGSRTPTSVDGVLPMSRGGCGHEASSYSMSPSTPRVDGRQLQVRSR